MQCQAEAQQDYRSRSKQDVRVLVAGSTGYIGKYVTKELINRGYNVVAFAREKSGVGGKQSRDQTQKVCHNNVLLLTCTLGAFQVTLCTRNSIHTTYCTCDSSITSTSRSQKTCECHASSLHFTQHSTVLLCTGAVLHLICMLHQHASVVLLLIPSDVAKPC